VSKIWCGQVTVGIGEKRAIVIKQEKWGILFLLKLMEKLELQKTG
jgi:hypothetical protein